MTIPIKGPKHLTSSLITVAKEPALEKCPEYFACEPGSLPLPGWCAGSSKPCSACQAELDVLFLEYLRSVQEPSLLGFRAWS